VAKTGCLLNREGSIGEATPIARCCTETIRNRVGIAPYMAMELCLFDLMPKDLPPFVRGFTAALISTTACYPLDTIR
jgi:hypothetical protein